FISSLPPPFRLHKPILARAASTEARTPARAPSFSVCWSVTAPLPEVLNAMTGKLESGQPSLLCKQSMFARWQYLMRRLSPLKVLHLLYKEAKLLCPAYQVLHLLYNEAKLLCPAYQDLFTCELVDPDPRFLFA
ncbi:Adenosine deaminase, partial [Operophtera brumata]